VGIITGAVGITYAHELIHRRQRFEVFLGEILLLMVLYMHWKVEHVRGHHAHVGTPDDPATAPEGSTIYGFIPRSIVGGWISSWKLEAERLKRNGRRVFSLSNYTLLTSILQLAVLAGIWLILGTSALIFFIAQAGIGIILLEIVNYIEHYGLSRKQLESGGYERPHPGISWNSDHRLTNAFLINLQRHSDHHTRPRVPYPLLHTHENAPSLPFGYATMILISFIPPLYRKVLPR
jgi:alkane 1-monooxygenase